MARSIIVDAELEPSRALAVLVAAAHVAAAASPWLAGLPAWAAIAIAGLVLGWGVRQIRSFALLRDPGAVLRFQLFDDGRLVLHRRGSPTEEAGCSAIETIGPWGSVVRWRAPGARESRLLVWRDQCDARTMRRLRIAARWRAGIRRDGERGASFGETRDLV